MDDSCRALGSFKSCVDPHLGWALRIRRFRLCSEVVSGTDVAIASDSNTLAVIIFAWFGLICTGSFGLAPVTYGQVF